MDNIEDHPGYLGFTSRGVIAIHADWPAYPQEHGWQIALANIGQFPRSTAFTAIDDIDQCFLFLVGSGAGIKNPFSDQHFHVAVWHKDLEDLHRQELISGAGHITLGEWIERRRKELSGLFYQGPDGKRIPVRGPTIEDFGDDEEALRLMIGSAGIQITDRGWRTLEQLLADERDKLHEAIRLRALPIVSLGQFDSAIREGCLVLENRLRTACQSDLFGVQLVAAYVARLRASHRLIEAYVKGLHSELRTAFKYVRNEYMHNIKELTSVQCYAVLGRLSSILYSIDAMEAVLAKPDMPSAT
jgi:hypothetical protein